MSYTFSSGVGVFCLGGGVGGGVGSLTRTGGGGGVGGAGWLNISGPCSSSSSSSSSMKLLNSSSLSNAWDISINVHLHWEAVGNYETVCKIWTHNVVSMKPWIQLSLFIFLYWWAGINKFWETCLNRSQLIKKKKKDKVLLGSSSVPMLAVS